MSTADRLRRLGLEHLADKPEELKKALEQIAAKGRKMPEPQDRPYTEEEQDGGQE